jgi:hypothetical protein
LRHGWAILFIVFGVLAASPAAPTLSTSLGGSRWMWLAAAAAIIAFVTLSPNFISDFSRSRVGCFYCWLIGVIAPWAMLSLAYALDFSDAENLRMQSALLVLAALGVMVVRRFLARLN